MPPFELSKALREEIAALGEIDVTLARRASALERQCSELEVERLAIYKLLGFARIELTRKRELLRKTEEEEKS